MREYNDYVQTTKEYLKHYHEFKVAIDNMNDEIEAEEKMLSIEPSAPTPKYGDDTGGGRSELTPAEAEAAKRIAIQEGIERKRLEVERIERAIRKVDRALDALPGQDRQLVEGYYFERKSWKELSIDHFMTEKWARVATGKAVKKMAGMIFGFFPEQQSLFVFFE